MEDRANTDHTLENVKEDNLLVQSLRLSPIRIEGLVYPNNDLSPKEKRDIIETIKTVLSIRFGCTEESITLKFI